MKKKVSITKRLIIANISVYIAVIVISAFWQGIIESVALQPLAIWQGRNLWTLITSMFMHAGMFHLFVNMFSLFFLGSFLEN